VVPALYKEVIAPPPICGWWHRYALPDPGLCDGCYGFRRFFLFDAALPAVQIGAIQRLPIARMDGGIGVLAGTF